MSAEGLARDHRHTEFNVTALLLTRLIFLVCFDELRVSLLSGGKFGRRERERETEEKRERANSGLTAVVERVGVAVEVGAGRGGRGARVAAVVLAAAVVGRARCRGPLLGADRALLEEHLLARR